MTIRVYVCDDDPAFRYLTRLELAQADILVIGESDAGKQALEDIARSGPDIALLDHSVLYEVDDETLRAAVAACPGTRFLIYSSMPAAYLDREARDRGLHGYIEKHDAQSLVSGVRHYAPDALSGN